MYNDFKKQVLGKGYDYDGAYGNQCWDLYAVYSKNLGVPVFHCTSSGYVKDLWLNRKTSGILKYFDEVKELQAGDIVIFKECKATPYSHVAIFDSDIDGKQGWFLGQNQGASVVNLVKLPYSATYSTAFRVKTLKKESLNLVAETATAIVKIPAIKIRKYPSTVTGEDTGQRWVMNDRIKYDCYCINDGYVWVSYKVGDGTRRYVAVGEADGRGINVNPYCNFE